VILDDWIRWMTEDTKRRRPGSLHYAWAEETVIQ